MRAGEPGRPQSLGADGPRPSFKDVYRSMFPRVWRLLRRLGIPERHQADVAQETFRRVARRLHTYDPTVDLAAWVFKLANHAATHHRRLARNHRELLADDQEGFDSPRWDDRLASGEGPEPERHVANRELCSLVDRLLTTIPDVRVRFVLVMHDIEQMTTADIARALGIPESTARDRLAKGRKYVRAAVRSLDPLEREALGIRRSRVVPFFPLDLARLAEAERDVDERGAEIQEQLWGRLQERARGAENGGRMPGGPVRRAMGRIPISAGRALGAGLLVFVAGAAVSAGIFASLPRAAAESEAPAVIAPNDVVFAGATTTPTGATPGAMAASPTGAAPQSSAPAALPTTTATAAIPRAAANLHDEEDLLLNRARAHLTRSTPRPDLAITSLRLHAQKYPDSPRARDRESMLRTALALAAPTSPDAAGAATSSAPGDGR